MTKGQDLGVDVDAFCTGDMEVVETKYGPVSVTICGDRRLSPIVTYHEVGTNHTTAFQSLIMATNPTSLFLANHCFYHIDAPGSEEGATSVFEGMIPMTLEKLCDQVAGVVSHYHLSEVVGLGVGVGASILLMYAAIHPTKVAGLILISPAVLPTSSPLAFASLDILTGGANQLTASAWEGTVGSSVVKGLWAGSNAGWIREHFVARLFGKRHQSSARQSDLVRAFRRDIERIPANGLMQLLQAALNRSSLLPLAKKTKCRTLLVWGGHSHYRFEARKLNTVMPPGRCHFMEMDDCGTLVPAEDPNSLLSPINLFLLSLQQEGFGLSAQAATAPAEQVQEIPTPSASIWA